MSAWQTQTHGFKRGGNGSLGGVASPVFTWNWMCYELPVNACFEKIFENKWTQGFS